MLRAAPLASLADAAGSDLRFALRLLVRRPVLYGVVIVTLGVGVAAPATALSLLSGLMFRPPVPANAERFVRVARADRGNTGVATAVDYGMWRDQARSFDELAAWSTLALKGAVAPGGDGGVTGLLVTCNFFRVFGVDRPVAGRLFDADDCRSPEPVAVISHAMWRDRFQAAPEIVGASLRFGGIPVTVVGVAAGSNVQQRASGAGPDLAPDLWFPVSAQRALKDRLALLAGRDFLAPTNRFPWLEVAGLLRPGLSRAAATAEIDRITADGAAGISAGRVLVTDGSRWQGNPTGALTFSAAALVLPLLVLVAACTNAATLLVASAMTRQHEFATRLALGVSPAGLLRMLLIEATLVTGLATLLSLYLVHRLPLLAISLPGAGMWFGAGDAIRVDWPAVACFVGSTVLAAVLACLAPAVASRRVHFSQVLKVGGGARSTPRASRVLAVLVAVQLAASVVPLVAALTMARSANHAAQLNLSTDRRAVAAGGEGQTSAVRRLQSVVFGMGLVSTLLAVVGVVGIGSLESKRRAKELAVRMALGARPRHLHSAVVIASLRPVTCGILGGVVPSWAVLSLMNKGHVMLLPANLAHPTPYIMVITSLFAVTVLVLLAVSYAASRRNPMLALRGD